MIRQGGGNFHGQPSVTVLTDSEGFARTTMTLGPEPGVADQIVFASTENNTGPPVYFKATAERPGDPGETTVAGVVLDNTSVPIAGVTVSLMSEPWDEPIVTARTDAEGQFALPAVPGAVFLEVDGATALREGKWAKLTFQVVALPGLRNTLGMPIHLVEINQANTLHVSETVGGTLQLEGVPGFAMEVAPGAVTFRDGSREGDISVTVVHADKVPMTPNFGQQPRLVVTVQPPGAVFDPPAKVTYPNLDGHGPGKAVPMYSFDHDMERFLPVGTGTVGEDGLTIVSDAGTGVRKSGWFCSGAPAPTSQCQNAFAWINPTPALLFPGEVIPIRGIGGPGPDNATPFSWTIDDTSVATFVAAPQALGQGLSEGTIKGVSPGVTTIRTTYTNDNGQTDTATAQVAVLELEFVDLYNEMNPDDDQTITDGDVAKIKAAPEMPNFVARLKNGLPGLSVNWRLNIKYEQVDRNDLCEFPILGPERLQANEEWRLRDHTEWHLRYCGGDAELTYEIEGKDKRSLKFKLHGLNPRTQVTVRDYLADLRHQLIALGDSFPTIPNTRRMGIYEIV